MVAGKDKKSKARTDAWQRPSLVTGKMVLERTHRALVVQGCTVVRRRACMHMGEGQRCGREGGLAEAAPLL